jgi:hypothetical protein
MTTPTVNRLAAFLEGLATADPATLDALSGTPKTLNCGTYSNLEDPWVAAAFRELQARFARICAGLDFETLMDIARSDLDARAVAKHVAGELRARAAHPGDEPEPPSWEALDATLREHLTTVAHRFLRFETLESRHRDALDFREVGFGSVRDALTYAYFMGVRARDRK